MLGYRIYYDETNNIFKRDESLSEIGKVTDVCIWNCNLSLADKAVIRLNKHMKQTIDELQNNEDFIILKCKDCGERFILKKSLIDWYRERDLNIPVRCQECRSKRSKKGSKHETNI